MQTCKHCDRKGSYKKHAALEEKFMNAILDWVNHNTGTGNRWRRVERTGRAYLLLPRKNK